MDDYELLYRLMNKEDPWYMGNPEEEAEVFDDYDFDEGDDEDTSEY